MFCSKCGNRLSDAGPCRSCGALPEEISRSSFSDDELIRRLLCNDRSYSSIWGDTEAIPLGADMTPPQDIPGMNSNIRRAPVMNDRVQDIPPMFRNDLPPVRTIDYREEKTFMSKGLIALICCAAVLAVILMFMIFKSFSGKDNVTETALYVNMMKKNTPDDDGEKSDVSLERPVCEDPPELVKTVMPEELSQYKSVWIADDYLSNKEMRELISDDGSKDDFVQYSVAMQDILHSMSARPGEYEFKSSQSEVLMRDLSGDSQEIMSNLLFQNDGLICGISGGEPDDRTDYYFTECFDTNLNRLLICVGDSAGKAEFTENGCNISVDGKEYKLINQSVNETNGWSYLPSDNMSSAQGVSAADGTAASGENTVSSAENTADNQHSDSELYAYVDATADPYAEKLNGLFFVTWDKNANIFTLYYFYNNELYPIKYIFHEEDAQKPEIAADKPDGGRESRPDTTSPSAESSDVNAHSEYNGGAHAPADESSIVEEPAEERGERRIGDEQNNNGNAGHGNAEG